jgi:hypothetical protein
MVALRLTICAGQFPQRGADIGALRGVALQVPDELGQQPVVRRARLGYGGMIRITAQFRIHLMYPPKPDIFVL